MDQLSEEAIQGLVQEFILREGTDYGQQEYTLDQKTEQVLKQLNNGKVLIVFDPVTETPSLMRKEDARANL